MRVSVRPSDTERWTENKFTCEFKKEHFSIKGTLFQPFEKESIFASTWTSRAYFSNIKDLQASQQEAKNLSTRDTGYT